VAPRALKSPMGFKNMLKGKGGRRTGCCCWSGGGEKGAGAVIKRLRKGKESGAGDRRCIDEKACPRRAHERGKQGVDFITDFQSAFKGVFANEGLKGERKQESERGREGFKVFPGMEKGKRGDIL